MPQAIFCKRLITIIITRSQIATSSTLQPQKTEGTHSSSVPSFLIKATRFKV